MLNGAFESEPRPSDSNKYLNPFENKAFQNYRPKVPLDFMINNFHLKTADTLEELGSICELKNKAENTSRKELEYFDLESEHIIVVDLISNTTVGYCRIYHPENFGVYPCQVQFSLSDYFFDINKKYIEVGPIVTKQSKNIKLIEILIWAAVSEYLKNITVDEMVFNFNFPVSHNNVLSNIHGYLYRHYKSKGPKHCHPHYPVFINWEDGGWSKNPFVENALPYYLSQLFSLGAKILAEPGWNKSKSAICYLVSVPLNEK